MDQAEEYGRILWDFLYMNQHLEKADIILVCGGHDLGVARTASKLYHQDFAKCIVVSGGIIREIFGESKKALEADILGSLIIKNGVPESSILFERNAKNTGENLDLTEKLLIDKGISFNSIILIQKPYAERRAWCLAKKKWPKKHILMASEKTTFTEYLNGNIPKDKIISMMVGEIQRLIYSPKFGWIDEIEIPSEVLKCYKLLCEKGYTERLMSKDVIERCLAGTQDNISINANN